MERQHDYGSVTRRSEIQAMKVRRGNIGGGGDLEMRTETRKSNR